MQDVENTRKSMNCNRSGWKMRQKLVKRSSISSQIDRRKAISTGIVMPIRSRHRNRGYRSAWGANPIQAQSSSVWECLRSVESLLLSSWRRPCIFVQVQAKRNSGKAVETMNSYTLGGDCVTISKTSAARIGRATRGTSCVSIESPVERWAGI